MAPFSNFISLLFLTTLFLSLQVNARDSKFFSKVTHVNNNNNVKETELVPNNEGPVNKPEKRPVFIPETENNYGLYGHETGMHPPTTTTTSYEPYKTESEEVTTKFPNNNYYNKDSYNTNQNEMSDTARFQGSSYSNDNVNNNYYNSKDAYEGQQNELSNTKYTEGEYNSMANQNNDNNNNQKYHYNNNNNNGANDRYSFKNNNDRYYSYNSKAANDKYNGERQGLSDTRFMEGGKYFYDVNSEKFDPTYYGGSSRGAANSENWYNYRGYFGSKTPNSSYKNKNSMEGYQNQEEVFEDDQDEFDP